MQIEAYPSMEVASSRIQDTENPSPTTSPNNNGGVHQQIQTPPTTPTPVSRSDTNPYPTTFVQANTSTFKQVVQMLTGSTETAKQASQPDPPQPTSGKVSIPPIKTGGQKKQGFKLYERRNSLKNGLMINPSSTPKFGHHNSVYSPRMQEILSPSILDFPSLVLSPVTPLIEDLSSMGNSCSSEEDRAIANKGFYLHPSPRQATPRGAGEQPQLLPLFPVTSPRVSGSSS